MGEGGSLGEIFPCVMHQFDESSSSRVEVKGEGGRNEKQEEREEREICKRMLFLGEKMAYG